MTFGMDEYWELQHLINLDFAGKPTAEEKLRLETLRKKLYEGPPSGESRMPPEEISGGGLPRKSVFPKETKAPADQETAP
jgi:hypothetical protein